MFRAERGRALSVYHAFLIGPVDIGTVPSVSHILEMAGAMVGIEIVAGGQSKDFGELGPGDFPGGVKNRFGFAIDEAGGF